MKINDTFWVNKSKINKADGTVVNGYKSNLFEDTAFCHGVTEFPEDSTGEALDAYKTLQRIHRHLISDTSDLSKTNAVNNLLHIIDKFTPEERAARQYKKEESASTSTDTTTTTTTAVNKEELTRACQMLIDFFKQFDYSPSYRFVNTLCLSLDPKTYVRDYFKIFDSQYAKSIEEKIKSPEFANILKMLRKVTPKHRINNHLAIYYGEPGGGKTTYAQKLVNTTIVCSSEMLPDSLMQVFDFDEGKPTFKKSDLWLAMENGQSILLDEFNLLPYESVRFIQGITDNKDEINYKGTTIKIHPNFKIIGTMNLYTENGTYPISAALADRAYEIREFVLTASNLVQAILSED